MLPNIDENNSEIDSVLDDIDLDQIEVEESTLFQDILNYVNDNNSIQDLFSEETFIDFIDYTFDSNELNEIYDIVDKDESLRSSLASIKTINEPEPESSHSKGRRRKRNAKPIVKNRGKCLKALYEQLKYDSKARNVSQEVDDNQNHVIMTRNKLKNQIREEKEKNNKGLNKCRIVLTQFILRKDLKTLNIKKDINLMYESIDNGFKCIFCHFISQSFNRSIIENHLKVKHWNYGKIEFKTQFLDKLRKRFNDNNKKSVENEVKLVKRHSIRNQNSENKKKLIAFLNRNLKSPDNRLIDLKGVKVLINKCSNLSIGPKHRVIVKKHNKSVTKYVSKGG